MKKILILALCMICSVIRSGTEVSAAALLNSAEEITEEKEEIRYVPSVKQELLKDIEGYTVEEKDGICEVILPKTEQTALVAAGDHVILPGNEENPAGAALIVSGIVEEDDGFRWYCEEPEELSDFLESIDISGYGERVLQQEGGNADLGRARGIAADASNQISDIGRLTYQFHDTYLSDSVILNGAVSIEVSSIAYRLKMDIGKQGCKVEDFYFAVHHTVDMSADFSVRTRGKSTGGTHMLGSVPFLLGKTGVQGEITFWLTYDVTGNVNVTYTLSNTAGIVYEQQGCRTFAENQNAAAALAGLDFTAGPDMQIVLTYGRSMKLLDVVIKTGFAGTGNVSVKEQGPEDNAYQLDAYAYLKLYQETDGFVNRALGLKDIVLWNEETSPYHKVFEGTF